MQINEKTALGIAQAAVDKGLVPSGATFEEARSALLKKGQNHIMLDGERVELRSLVVEQPSDTMVVVSQADDERATDSAPIEAERSAKSVAKPKPAPVPNQTADRDVAALVAAEVARQAASAATQPREVVRAVSPAERIWETRRRAGTNVFDSAERAIAWHTCLQLSALDLDQRTIAAKRQLLDNLHVRGYTTTSGSYGSALVPEGFVNDLIYLVSERGVARRLARIVNMTTSPTHRMRATGARTVSYVGENTAPTEDTGVTYDNVTLSGQEGTINVIVSRSLSQDSAIDISEQVARELAHAVATVEDNTMFGATGQKIAGRLGLQTAAPVYNEFNSGTASSSVRSAIGGDTALATTADQVTQFMALLPSHARNGSVIVCSPAIEHAIFHRLSRDVGGVTLTEFESFGVVTKYAGRPVIVTDVMNESIDVGGDAIDAFYGNFSDAVMLGIQSDFTVEVSSERYIDQRSLGIFATIRHDLNAHNIGTASTKGSVVALYQT